MLDPNPSWSFDSNMPLTKWYGHVHLMPSHVIGQWFCIDRSSGRLSWQRTMFRPNTISGIDSGIIVASETRSDGPWTASFGCYGISLDTGKLLWTSHGSSWWGRFVRLLDYIPGFTNEMRDTPRYINDGKVICHSGRVLDIKTGRLLEKIDPELVRDSEILESISSQYFSSRLERKHPSVSVGDGLFLRHAQDAEGWQRGILKISAETEDGESVWQFSIEQLGRYIDGSFSSYRLVPPFIYLVVSDEARFKPHPTEKHYALPNPTNWHIVTLDLATGNVVQDFPLGNEKLEECCIEDVDEDDLLISKSNNSLFCYQRMAHHNDMHTKNQPH